MNRLKKVSLRLPANIILNILDPLVEQLLPKEYRSGQIRVQQGYEYCPETSKTIATIVWVTVVEKCIVRSGESYPFSLLSFEHWGRQDGEISVSSVNTHHWAEGSMGNQRYWSMKSHVIVNKFSLAIQEYLKDR